MTPCAAQNGREDKRFLERSSRFLNSFSTENNVFNGYFPAEIKLI